jgi:hypothetical protein
MHGGSQQAAPMAAYSPQQSAPQSGMQAWGQQSGQRMVPHPGNLTVMVPEQSGGPGRAQSIQPQSQGTPYGGQAPDDGFIDFNRWRNGTAGGPSPGNRNFGTAPAASAQQQAPRPSNSAFADAWNFSMEGNASRMAPARTFGGGGPGNMAYMPDNARPDPFTSYSIGPDGRQVSQQQSLNNRDALISALIQDNAQHAGRSGVYQGRGNPPPEFMAPPPPPNIPALWGQAQNAVSNGWVSPAAGLWG